MDFRNFGEIQVMRIPKKQNGRNVKKLISIIEEKYHVKLDDYWDLHQWSVDHMPEFYAELWDFLGIISSKRFEKVIDLNVPMSESPKWFEGAELNYSENLLKYRDDYLALIVTGEDREAEVITYKQMYEQVRLYAAAFRKFGLKKGDTVVCHMSNRKEAVFSMQAIISIGAIWAGALPLLGAKAVQSRFKQVKPKVYLTVDRFRHDGKEIEMLSKVKEIVDDLSSLEKVIIVASQPDSVLKDISGIKNSCFLDDFLKTGLEKDGSVPQMKFEQVTFSHPIFISYTSGTTGLPKGIMHGFGASLAIVNSFFVNSDCDRNSVWLSVSPVGWVTWILATALLSTGQTILLFEGSPYFLSPTYLWDMVDKYKISNILFPTNILDEIQKRRYVPTEKHCLGSLKFIVAGGSVVKPQNFDFVYKILKNTFFSPSYGCTETIGATLISEITLPVYKGELNAPGLGIAINIVDDTGKVVLGEMGDVVLSKPAPCLPVGLWGDVDGSIYKEKYFSKHPEKFTFGDFGIRNPVTKGFVICCRSDETVNQGGCRFGSSEIYNIVEAFPEIDDSLCVSHTNKDMDEIAVLFLKMKHGSSYGEGLVGRVRNAIARELTEDHIPKVIVETKDIPYNINGKKMEVIVKKIINKLPHDTGSVINPESLRNFYNVPELNEF